ncbi:MAG: hypothetical protein V2I67_00465 [Thermoanaerobaculales bacterium]|jgi:Tol biopolymer transport system component|nr:hypothetical protein [Thermoanaerobaculales bacterium]
MKHQCHGFWVAFLIISCGLVLGPCSFSEADPIATERKLNHDLDGWSVLDFIVSSNGQWVVFRTDDYGSGLEALYSVPADGSAPPTMLYYQAFGAALGIHEYRITADSARVIYHGDTQTDGVDELFSIRMNGVGGAVKLNDNLGGWSVLDFELSADGQWVVYRTDDWGSGLNALYSVPANRSFPPAMLYAQTSGAALGIHEYRITGDSSRVVYRGDTQTNGVDELFSILINGSAGAAKLNHDLGGWSVLDFEVSPNGQRVVFRTDDWGSGLNALYSVPADDSAPPTTLYYQAFGAALGIHEYRITGDSSRVVYRGDTQTNGVDEIFSIVINGSAGASKLNHDLGGSSVLDFEVSPNGHWVVFQADDWGSGLNALYSVPADDGAPPNMLYYQAFGAALGIHEYRITGDSSRVVYRGDTETDGVDELFSISITGSGGASKLNHDLGGWSVLDFEISSNGQWVVFRTDDWGSGLEALYSVPADDNGPVEMLYYQAFGAALGIHEYEVTGDSARVVYRGDTQTDGVDELFSVDLDFIDFIFIDGFESGNLSAWSDYKL